MFNKNNCYVLSIFILCGQVLCTYIRWILYKKCLLLLPQIHNLEISKNFSASLTQEMNIFL